MASHPPPFRTIAQAEQESGLSKDVLRVWERRYGFPAPLRDSNGDRVYPSDQIRKLQLLRRLTDMGMRPARLIGLDEGQLAERVAELQREPCRPLAEAGTVDECLSLVAASAMTALELRFNAEIMRLGLERFSCDLAAPLCTETGNAWQRGDIDVHQEHLFSLTLARCLRKAIEGVKSINTAKHLQEQPYVLLTTPSGEIHELGLLMVEAILCSRNVDCLNLGPQLPLDEIERAASRYGCKIVALSLSFWFDTKKAETFLHELRLRLPADIRLWVGGANAALRRPLPKGIEVFSSLEAIAPTLAKLPD